MKFFISVLLLCCVGFSQQEDRAALIARAKKISEKCEADNGIEKGVPKKAFTEHNFPEDQNFKCYLKCVYQGLEFANADGKMNLEKVEPYILPLNKRKILAGLDECNKQTGKDPCDTTYQIAMCGQKVVEPFRRNH
nr:odorant-binding protein 6 [Podabrus annulatus]